MDVSSVRIETPLHEMRIGAMHRGSGPRDAGPREWDNFDEHLVQRAINRGAHLVRGRVDGVDAASGRPVLVLRGGRRETYDLLAVAAGVNASVLKAFEAAGIGYRSSGVTKTFIREYQLGRDEIGRVLWTIALERSPLAFRSAG